MPYPGQFYRLVIIGNLYADTFNTSLSMVPTALGELSLPAVDEAVLEAIADDVSAWWTTAVGSGGAGTTPACRLTGIKYNRIGPDGRYVDAETMEWTYPAPIPGVGSGTVAAQLSLAVTLATAVPRGRASKGRMFLPPTTALTTLDGNTGLITVAAATAQATGVKGLIDRLNFTGALVSRVGVASDAGAGRFEHVTEVRVGRVPDTMRSRRSKLVEDYQAVPI